MSAVLYDWQTEAWQGVQAMRARLPHALLLYGMPGIGKTVFAEHLAQSLLCENPDVAGHACSACQSCTWFVQYSHPDYRRVRPEILEEGEVGESEESTKADSGKTSKTSKAPSREIVIAQIRALADFMNISTHRQGLRVIVLYPAEALNVPAANALLKSLEEPSANTVFILVSDQIDRLLPTILSRCHKLALPAPAPEQALAWLHQQGVADAENWLALQGGAPLAALSSAQADWRDAHAQVLAFLAKPQMDVALKLADQVQKLDLAMLVDWLQRWLYDLHSYQLSGRIRYYPAQARAVHGLAAQLDQFALLDILKRMADRQAVAKHPLSPKLFVEEMLLDYCSLAA